jgi:hypothetical protein
MLKPLPIPLEFDLPGPEWVVIPDPAVYDVEEAAFMAMRRGVPGDYVPSIIISGGLWPADASLELTAQDALVVFSREVGSPVEVIEHHVLDGEVPLVGQTLEATTELEGRSVVLDQLQIFEQLIPEGPEAPDATIGIVYRLTALREQMETVRPEFMRFFDSVQATVPR